MQAGRHSATRDKEGYTSRREHDTQEGHTGGKLSRELARRLKTNEAGMKSWLGRKKVGKRRHKQGQDEPVSKQTKKSPEAA